jgi:pyruvate dehydrogenase E1 component
VAASDYMKVLPESIAQWVPRSLFALGTDGFGRSETRACLRDFFEVDYRYVVVATLAALAREGKIEASVVRQAIQSYNINPDKSDPAIS